MNGSELLDILFDPFSDKLEIFHPSLPKEYLDLENVPQDPTWHPEGNLHYGLVVKETIKIVGQNKTKHNIELALAAFCHDLGKVTCTFFHEKKQKWVSYGHDVEGEKIAINLLKNLGLEEYSPVVSKLVRYHMSHCVKNWTEKSVKKLVDNLFPANFNQLLILMIADCRARPPLSGDLPDSVIQELLPIYSQLYIKPLLGK